VILAGAALMFSSGCGPAFEVAGLGSGSAPELDLEFAVAQSEQTLKGDPEGIAPTAKRKLCGKSDDEVLAIVRARLKDSANRILEAEKRLAESGREIPKPMQGAAEKIAQMTQVFLARLDSDTEFRKVTILLQRAIDAGLRPEPGQMKSGPDQLLEEIQAACSSRS
jgi:hypothetical protein